MLPRLLLVLGAVLFSTGGAAIKLSALNTWSIASLRSGVAALFLLALYPEARRIGRRDLLVAVAYAATMILFVGANRFTTAANAVFLQASAPLYVIGLAPALLGERARRGDLLAIPPLALGILALCLGVPGGQRTAPDPWLGNALGAAAGLTWGLTVVGLRRLGRGGGSGLSAVVAGNAITWLAAAPPSLLGGDLLGLALTDALVVLWLGLFQIGLAYVCVTRALGRVPALEAALILLIEPACSPLFAWAVHGEVAGPWPLLGGALLLATTLGRALRRALG